MAKLKDPLAQQVVDMAFLLKGVHPLYRERVGDQIATTHIFGFGGPGKNNVVKFTTGIARKCFLQSWKPVEEDNPVAGWVSKGKIDISKGEISDTDMDQILNFLAEDFLEPPQKFPALFSAADPIEGLASAMEIDHINPIDNNLVEVVSTNGEPIQLKGFAANRVLREINPRGKIIVRHCTGIFRLLKDAKFQALYAIN